MHDRDTNSQLRLRIDTKYSNADGVFFQTHLEVTCERGTAPLTVTFVNLVPIKTSQRASIEFVAYALDGANCHRD